MNVQLNLSLEQGSDKEHVCAWFKKKIDDDRAAANELADRLEKFAGTRVAVKMLRAGQALPKEIEKFEKFAEDFEAQCREITE